MKSSLLILLTALGTTLFSGCAHVHPWERGSLADPTMDADQNPVGAMLADHMWFSREAATGGKGVGGGGCGCN